MPQGREQRRKRIGESRRRRSRHKRRGRKQHAYKTRARLKRKPHTARAYAHGPPCKKNIAGIHEQAIECQYENDEPGKRLERSSRLPPAEIRKRMGSSGEQSNRQHAESTRGRKRRNHIERCEYNLRPRIETMHE